MIDKNEIWHYAKSFQEEKMKELTDAIKKVQESGNSEQKSSMGDKYETARAMSQNEIYMLSKQLEVLKTEYNKLLKVNPDKSSNIGEIGALVQTETIYCFIAAAIGNLNINNQKVAIISEVSPLAKAIFGKSKGDFISIANKQVRIRELT